MKIYGRAIQSPRKRGLLAFTLIELLVVIAIIALLVSILLPSLKKAQDLAKEVTCMSNMRSTYMAIVLYAEDNDNWCPYSSVSWGPPYWETFLMPYAESAKGIFMCPTEHWEYEDYIKARWNEQWFINLYGQYGDCVGGRSYIANASFIDDFTRTPRLRLNGADNPDQVFLFFDAASPYPTLREYSSYLSVQNSKLLKYIHREGMNIAFTDGHLEWKSEDEVHDGYGPGRWW